LPAQAEQDAHVIIFPSGKFYFDITRILTFASETMLKLVCRGLAGRLFVTLGALLALTTAPACQAKALEYALGPAPAWVVPIAPAPAARKAHSAVGGVESLLSDMQTRIDAGGKTTFVHLANKPLSSDGLDSVANIAIAFEPSYQTLTLHAISLVRAGKVIDKLRSARIDVLQRETELEYRIYDGRKTVNVDLDDVRVGDLVEYSYSVSGLNPVFQNKVAGEAALQFHVPVDRIFVRLLAPTGRPVKFDNRNTKLQPQVSDSGGYRDYRWDLASVPGLRVEKDAPPGFDPKASVAWTEFADWGAVLQWALPLYRHGAPGPAVSAEIARIAAASQVPSDRLREVLRLVQRDIRYLGVEIGASSHAPAAPDVVFKRRFGDCKDKATLVVAMLTALGIEAHPALVHTDGLAATAHATPHAFNHVIARAQVDDTIYWIDPTRPEQQGDLAHLYEPDYGMALVLEAGSGKLVRMNSPSPARRSVRAEYNASAGYDKPVAYTISTTVRGSAADSMRAQLASKGTAALELEYLNFYARTYPQIKSAQPLEVRDDLATNTLTLDEAYTIANFWQFIGKNRRQQGYIRSSELDSRLTAPQALNRVAPLGLTFPDEVEEFTRVVLPTEWDGDPEFVTVRTPAFEFTHISKTLADGRGFLLTDRYRALADRVLPGAMSAHADQLRIANEEVGLWLYSGERASAPAIKAHLDWRAVMAVILFLIVILFSLLLQTSAAAHRATDQKLLFCVIGAALVIVLASLLLDDLVDFWVASYLALHALALGAYKLSAGAPASHWTCPLVHEGTASERPSLFARLIRLIRLVPVLLFAVWMVILVASD
jgi:transglutaminase-like putative cysteine protease